MNTPKVIDAFVEEWAFLSNYYPVTIEFDGQYYPSVEHAYQAAKTDDPAVRRSIHSTLDPARAKEIGRSSTYRSDWDELKPGIMRKLVMEKFRNPGLRERLLATGSARLVEGNTWGDTYWGECDGIGENIMGKILMEVRDTTRHLTPTSGATRIAHTNLKTKAGELLAIGYEDYNRKGHVALVAGEVSGRDDVLVRVHSECLTGDALGSLRCDCGDQLTAATRMISHNGEGVVIYLRGHEGRGIGLLEKLRAYHVQDTKYLDTVDANLVLGLPVDARDYSVAAHIINDLGIRSIQLLSNNPAKVSGLTRYGIRVSRRVPLLGEPREANLRYLMAKRNRLGHVITNLAEASDAVV